MFTSVIMVVTILFGRLQFLRGLLALSQALVVRQEDTMATIYKLLRLHYTIHMIQPLIVRGTYIYLIAVTTDFAKSMYQQV